MTEPATVGIVGGGQLARMTAQAAIGLGIDFSVLAGAADDSAARVAAGTSVGSVDSLEALAAFAAGCDVLTFDHELVPPAHLAALEAAGHVLRPGRLSQRFAQDKAHQRAMLGALGIPVPVHRVVASIEELAMFGDELGWPVVLKAISGGYDGRGVWVLEDPRAARDLFRGGREYLAETFLPLDMELAVLVARRPGGETVTYPVVQSVQSEGMCREVVYPAPIPATVAAHAQGLALQVAEAVAAVGIIACELFLVDETLVLNEIALRPHNSGHFSIEGSITSQFENHLRAVLDWPLGLTTPAAPAAVMVNVVGAPGGMDPRRRAAAALEVPGVHLHLYGKEPRPGRKLGHVTALGDDPAEAALRARRAAALLTAGEVPA